MKITKIAPYGADSKFYKIFLDGQYALSLPSEIIARFSLKEGMETSLEEIEALTQASLVRKARERLLYSLDRRLHSEKELRDKLKGKYSPKTIDLAINEIARLGLIDDEKFATAFCKERMTVNKKGPYLVLCELYKKGVDKSLAKEVVDRVFGEGENEFESALAAAQKYKNDLDSPKGKQRLYGALMRKGFSYCTVKEVMRRLCSEIEFED